MCLYRWSYSDAYAPKTQDKDHSRDVRVFVCVCAESFGKSPLASRRDFPVCWFDGGNRSNCWP